MPPQDAHIDGKSAYLDLMKRCLTNWIYADRETVRAQALDQAESERMDFLTQRGYRVVKPRAVNPLFRQGGCDHKDGQGFPDAHTMIGLKRLDNLQYCVEEALRAGVPGDLIETGVWRGGAVIFMRALLRAHNIRDRLVWVADSFAGVPAPRLAVDQAITLHTVAELSVSQEEVQANFDRYGLLDDQVRSLKGWFRDTMSAAPIGALAVLRLDGDLYESTMDVLINLYAKVSVGGFIIVDDFHAYPACRQAVEDYRPQHAINDMIVEIDADGVFWRKSAARFQDEHRASSGGQMHLV